MTKCEEFAQELKFACLKYIQMVEGLGFYPTEEQEEGFNDILTLEQLLLRHQNAKIWYRNNYGDPKIYKLIYGTSTDMNRLKKMLKQQNFKIDRIDKIIGLLKD